MEPTWQTADGSVQLYLGDCLDILPQLADGSVDAVVTDPPYGIGYNHEDKPQSKHRFDHRRQLAPVTNDDQPFDPTPFVEYPFVMWGANNYASRLPDLCVWLCWDKVTRNGLDGLRIAECEFAASNCVRRLRVFRHLWSGGYRATERNCFVHPTQKPIALMQFCISLPGVPRGTILDPFMGSGTTGVACVRTGRKFIGIEIEPKYFEIAVKRIEAELNRAPLFDEPPQIVQRSLLDEPTQEAAPAAE